MAITNPGKPGAKLKEVCVGGGGKSDPDRFQGAYMFLLVSIHGNNSLMAYEQPGPQFRKLGLPICDVSNVNLCRSKGHSPVDVRCRAALYPEFCEDI